MLRREKENELRRAGLTLLELVVVLVILIALAAILVPMLPSMLTRAHTASGATSGSEITKFVQVYEQLFQSQPTDFDALTDTTTAAIPDYLPSDSSGVLGGQVASLTLTAAQANALLAAGISRVAPMYDTRANLDTAAGTPTFNPYSGLSVPVAANVRLLRLSEAAVEGPNGLVSDDAAHPGDVYVLLGFGKRCTMVGKVAADAPVHFGDSAADNAANTYGRFGLVYRLTRGSTGTPVQLDKAVFLGAVGLHPDGIVSVSAHIEEYYNAVRGQ